MPLSLVCYLHHVCINFCLYLQMIWYLNLDGQAGNPVYMSWPHFLHGDSILTEAVDGLTPPNVDNHSFVLDIQPEWGITLSAKARFQFNVLVEPSQEWPWMANVKDKVRTRWWLVVAFEHSRVLAIFCSKVFTSDHPCVHCILSKHRWSRVKPI